MARCATKLNQFKPMPEPATIDEKKKSVDHTRTKGVYADFSNWPKRVSFYAKCPLCGDIHGDYASLRDAHANHLCDGCNIKAIKKIKDQIKKAVYDPQTKVKPLSAIVNEAMLPEPPEDDEPDPTAHLDPMAEIDRLLLGNWPMVARRRLAWYLNCNIEDLELWENGRGYNADDPDASRSVEFSVGGMTYKVFKDYDTAEQAALEQVREDLEHQPEIFSQIWLANYIDKEKLKQAIGDPHADWGEDERNLDYEEKLELMVKKDQIYGDDALFFKLNGDQRIKTAAREQQLDAVLEKWLESTKPEVDPWEWLEDVYGKDEAVKEALNMVSIDIDEAAAAAIREDGWVHFMSSYDGNSIDLPGNEGFIAIRTN
jgi:hypothetical protein